MASLKTFLNDLFKLGSGQYIEVRPVYHGRMVYDKWSFVNRIDDVLSFTTQEYSKYDIYFGIAARKFTDMGVLYYDTYRCLAFDVDRLGKDDCHAILDDFRSINLSPRYVVSSGEGLHCYLIIKPTADTNKVMELTKAISRMIRSDERVIKPSQFMRLPKTSNNGVKAQIIYQSKNDVVYDIDEISAILKIKEFFSK